MLNEAEGITAEGLTIARQFPQTAAFGISGSLVQGYADRYSDCDFCVFTNGDIPSADQKRHIYGTMGISKFDYFDVYFETSNGDGFSIDGRECGFIWMELRKSRDLMAKLDVDWDLDEYLPGGVERMKVLFESNREIQELKESVRYTDRRSIGRFKLMVERAHYGIYVLRWLEKAAYRSDYYSFMKNAFGSIELLIYALYALNKKWMADEKRILQLVRKLDRTPHSLESRLREIILHTNGNEDLNVCLTNIKRLFAETIELFKTYHENEFLVGRWL